MKQIVSEKDVLTIKELKEFIKDLPDNEQVMCYKVGINSTDSWTSEGIGLTYNENKLFIDFNGIG